MKNVFLIPMTLVILSSCTSISHRAQETSPRYLFNWGYQKNKVPKKVLRQEVKRLSMSHYYHNENGATPDVVLVGRPPQQFGEALPNIFSLQIYQSKLDAGVTLEPVLKKGEYFDEKSGHTEVIPFSAITAETFKVNTAYWFSSAQFDWAKGKSVFFVTQKKGNFSPSEQLQKIYSHLQNTQSVFGTCSDAFVMYLTDEYSISFLHFKDESTFEKCVFSPEGQAVLDNLKAFRTVSLVTEIKTARGADLNPGEAVKVVTK